MQPLYLAEFRLKWTELLLGGQLPPEPAWGTGLSRKKTAFVQLQHIYYAAGPLTDRTRVRLAMVEKDAGHAMSIPWALQMKAISIEEPGHLIQTLTGAILGCGGWVLSRGANDNGTVNMLFEFERQACVDVYSILIASGLELSQSGHIRFTELCHCTRNQQRDCGTEIASIDLEVQTFPVSATTGVENSPAA